MTSVVELEIWFRKGVEKKATHMAVYCDTYDHEDYPVYITATDITDAKDKVKAAGGKMQRLMEVYKLTDPVGAQVHNGGRLVHNY